VKYSTSASSVCSSGVAELAGRVREELFEGERRRPERFPVVVEARHVVGYPRGEAHEPLFDKLQHRDRGQRLGDRADAEQGRRLDRDALGIRTGDAEPAGEGDFGSFHDGHGYARNAAAGHVRLQRGDVGHESRIVAARDGRRNVHVALPFGIRLIGEPIVVAGLRNAVDVARRVARNVGVRVCARITPAAGRRGEQHDGEECRGRDPLGHGGLSPPPRASAMIGG
jgi:hypothetical protein